MALHGFPEVPSLSPERSVVDAGEKVCHVDVIVSIPPEARLCGPLSSGGGAPTLQLPIPGGSRRAVLVDFRRQLRACAFAWSPYSLALYRVVQVPSSHPVPSVVSCDGVCRLLFLF